METIVHEKYVGVNKYGIGKEYLSLESALKAGSVEVYRKSWNKPGLTLIYKKD